MEFSLQTTFRGIAPSSELDAHIRENARRLGDFYARIKSCHVIVEVEDRQLHQGKNFNVRVELALPGNAIVVNRVHHEDPYIALCEAFNVAERQLEEYAQKQRGEVKLHANKRSKKLAEPGFGKLGAG